MKKIIRQIIDWIKEKLFGIAIEDIEIDMEGNVKSFTFYMYFRGQGWCVKNLTLVCGSYSQIVGDISNSPEEATKITLDCTNISTDDDLKLYCDFTNIVDGEVIKIKDVKLLFKEEYLTLSDTNKVYYELTDKRLGLVPISFSVVVEEYISPVIIEMRK